MNEKKLIQALGFIPKENTSGIFHKKYNDYTIEVDFDKRQFDFGKKIQAGRETTQNFLQSENWVVLECVDRLLEKGYKPENIILEKKYKVGHGGSGGWLDILVTRDNGSAYLMIECKTWGKEFEKEFKKTQKDGGQLFTYFQQDKDADIIMLYASELNNNKIQYRNEIIKIEEDYKQTSNVKDLFERWNKQTKANGVFDGWTTPYEFKSKALTRNDLKALKQEDSSYIFNRFLEILRHNVVSDKPNAFNKIFTLFLCKIVDEDRNEDEQLHFQWLEGEDNHISFQKRLTDLYNRGMLELLEKKVTDVSDSEFDKRFAQVDDKYKEQFQDILTEIRLKKNNEFAIKEVYDDASFNENAKVVKEVVELLQPYQIRYNYRQQFLSDFFELLLTTGLKQESGQFFTPVPVARFIIRSLPFRQIIDKKVSIGNSKDMLPTIIDYSAGSGHFLTESMEEVQKYIDNLDLEKYKPQTRRILDGYKRVQFNWAEDYVYAIEKDYRLVKTAKVSCYLHGDGLAKVIHGDGLGDFTTSTEFKDLLKETDKTYPQDNKQFDVIVSNPPYSVSAFKGQMEEETAKKGFDLYNRLTDQSSEIECLFIERTKQLLKDGGVAGVILPSSILSNAGIYTGAREIILKYFDILAITELGSNTFMATGTNTVTLFLRRRNNADWLNIQASVEKLFVSGQDVTINGIEKPLQKYIAHVWEDISFEDYMSLLQKKPNDTIKQYEIFKEYNKKIKVKKEEEKLTKIINLEKEKLLYFILAYKQKIVLVKTGQKTKEKQFLGYEFSNRRGSEGIHPIQRSKTIDECTQLYDPTIFDNPKKASTYIYKAFAEDKFDCKIPENLKENVSYQNLVDMLTFDRADFEKNISLSAKKKVKIESRWKSERLEELVGFQSGLWVGKKGNLIKTKVLRNTNFKLNNGKLSYEDIAEIEVEENQLETRKLQFGDIILEKSGGSDTQAIGRVVLFDKKDSETYSYSNFCSRVRVNDNNKVNSIYLWLILHKFYKLGGTEALQNGVRLLNIDLTGYKHIKIPLPPLNIQQKIVDEIEVLEKEEMQASDEIERLKLKITKILDNLKTYPYFQLNEISENLDNVRKPVTKSDRVEGKYPYYGASGVIDYVSDFIIDDKVLLISEDGANLKSRVYPIAFTATGKIWVNNHAHILKFNDWATHKLAEIYINNYDISEYITGQAQPKLNQSNLNNIKIPLPSPDIQQKIVMEIEKIEEKIKTLETKLAEIPQQKETVLKKYL